MAKKISLEKKESLLKKMAQNSNISLRKLAKENGVGYTTLCSWRQKMQATRPAVVVATTTMAGEVEGSVGNMSQPNINAENWPSNKKFLAVISTSSMNAHDKSEYCRSKGLYVEQVDAWAKVCAQANALSVQASSELREELKVSAHKVKELERELDRKEKALAEAAVLLVSRKKANAIWPDNEEDWSMPQIALQQ